MYQNITNCILLHGAWHGSWCWNKITSKLSKFSFSNIIAPDLPGHGQNHMQFDKITLSTYIDYISKIINKLDGKVVLVGHSMAGIIISQIAENIPNKISKLIYISGFIPKHNGSLLDEVYKAQHKKVLQQTTVEELNYAISFKNQNLIPKLFYNQCDKIDIDYAIKMLGKQPMQPFSDKVSLIKNFNSVPKLYIECLNDNAIHVEDQRTMYNKVDCNVVSIKTDHSPFFSMPEYLIEIIGKESNNK